MNTLASFSDFDDASVVNPQMRPAEIMLHNHWWKWKGEWKMTPHSTGDTCISDNVWWYD